MSTKNFNFSSCNPSPSIKPFVNAFWLFENISDQNLEFSIIPDGQFKIIVELIDERINNIFLTGIYTNPKTIISPKGAKVFGIQFKLLATEYVIKKEIAEILDSVTFINKDCEIINELKYEDINSFAQTAEHYVNEILVKSPQIDPRKQKLSELIYNSYNLSVSEIVKNSFWSHSQINRYLKKQVGLSAKEILSIVKNFNAIEQFKTDLNHNIDGYSDQSHFIRQIKKQTKVTPSKLKKNENDQFIQLKFNS